jgi:hypothetical protein
VDFHARTAGSDHDVNDLRTAWSAAVGQAPLRELVEARRGLDRATIRRVRRTVRRGEMAGSAREARLAVAIARDLQRRERPSGPKLRAFFAVSNVFFAGKAVVLLADGDIARGVFFIALVWCAWPLDMRGRRRRAAEQAERANVELLERCGQPYETPLAGRATVQRPRGPWLVACVVAAFVVFVAAFGTFVTFLDGDPVTVGHVIAIGLPFGVGMTIVNLIRLRKWNERAASAAAREPAGSTARIG